MIVMVTKITLSIEIIAISDSNYKKMVMIKITLIIRLVIIKYYDNNSINNNFSFCEKPLVN